MSKTTAVNAIPYPEDSDAPDGPTQLKALAELLDTLKWGSRNLKPTVGEKAATKELALSESYVDIEGASLTLTPAVASKLVVVSTFSLSELSSGAPFGLLQVDAIESLIQPIPNVTVNTTVTGLKVVSLTAAEHTVKLRAKRTGGANGKAVGVFIYALFAS